MLLQYSSPSTQGSGDGGADGEEQETDLELGMTRMGMALQDGNTAPAST